MAEAPKQDPSEVDDALSKQMQQALTGAAKRAVLGSDEASRGQRKKWLAVAGVVGGGIGLLLLWSLASKIGFYLLVFVFLAALFGGLYYLGRGRLEQWRAARLAARAEEDAARAEIDKRRAAEAELEALKRRAR